MKFLEYFLYLIIFLIPAYLLRFTLFDIPTNALEVLVSILFIVWATTKCKNQNAKIKITIQNSKVFTVGVLLLFLGLLLGIEVSNDIQVSLGVFKSWFIIPFLFFIVARDVLDTEGKKENALWSLAYSGIAVAITGFFYWLFGIFTFDGRLSAFYESPNMLAMHIAPALLIVTQELISNLKSHLRAERVCCEGRVSKLQFKIKNYVTFLALGFLVLSLVLTKSLGAFLGIALVVLCITLFSRWGKYKEKLLIWCGVFLVFIGIATPFISLFFNPWEMGRNSLASRVMVWRVSADIVKHNWLFGIGPGMFQKTYLTDQKNYPPYLEWAVPHPHNIFFEMWLYGGLAGFVGFLLILFWIFSKHTKKSSVVGRLSLVVVLYLLIHGAVDNTLFRADMAMMFWLIGAINMDITL